MGSRLGSRLFRAAVVAAVAGLVGCVDLTRPPDLVAPAPGALDAAALDAPAMASRPDAASADGGPGRPDGPGGPPPNDVGVDAPGVAVDAGPVAGDSGPSGPEPEPPLAIGQPCAEARRCASGHCVDGVCCNIACTGPCRSCALPGAAGACTPVTAGTDPENECPADPPSSCARDGTCDGAGGCRLHAAGTACAPSACTAGVEQSARTCDGNGRCREASQKPCAPYPCGAGGVCAATCSSSAPCAAGSFCQGGKCSGLLPLGGACTGDAQCASRFCVDGVCCNGRCDGPCSACNLQGAVGTCTPIPAGSDPQEECPMDAPATCGRDGVCDGNGACRRWAVGTQCGVQACDPGTRAQVSARACDGAGTCRPAQTTACAPYGCAGSVCASSCANDAGCASGHVCRQSACVPASGGIVVGAFAAVSSPINLTALGSMDWMHFGHPTPSNHVNRKATPDGGPRIAMALIGATSFGRYGDRPPRVGWTDGAPTATATDSPWGIFVAGPGYGFRMTLNATPVAVRVVRVWVGVYRGRGKLVARLTDNSAPAYEESSLEAGDVGQDRVYTVHFRARDPLQDLVVEWTTDSLQSGGNVTLQAVTLSQ